MTSHQPVRNNIPQINVLVDGRWKVRALVDSGATSSMLSTGLVSLLEMKDKMHATSFSFYGVGEDQMKFAGMFYRLPLRLTDVLHTVSPLAVYENT